MFRAVIVCLALLRSMATASTKFKFADGKHKCNCRPKQYILIIARHYTDKICENQVPLPGKFDSAKKYTIDSNDCPVEEYCTCDAAHEANVALNLYPGFEG